MGKQKDNRNSGGQNQMPENPDGYQRDDADAAESQGDALDRTGADRGESDGLKTARGAQANNDKMPNGKAAGTGSGDEPDSGLSDEYGVDKGSGGDLDLDKAANGMQNADVGRKLGKAKDAANPLRGAGGFFGDKLGNLGDGLAGGVAGVGRGVGDAMKGGVIRAGGGVAAVTGKAVASVASFLGVPKAVAGILSAAILVTSVVGGGLALSNHNYQQQMMSQEMIVNDCDEDMEAAADAAGSAEVADDQMEQNAAKAWAVMKAIGLSDEQAAGALGNMEGEGGFDPFTFECDFITAPDEKFRIGPKKQGFLNDLNAWTENFVFPYYKISLNYAFYRTSRHGAVAGVGICGFTGCNYDMLEDWAAGLGKEWTDEEMALDIQLSFIIAPSANGGYGKADWLTSWAGESVGSPEQAATIFCLKFEGNTMIADSKLTAARKWYDKFKGTMGDTAYAQSIIDLAGSTAGQAASDAKKNQEEECGVEEDDGFDNSDLAKAIVAYAYQTKDEGRGNDGTELYRELHKIIWPGDTYFQSCDRGVSTAVQWCDADNGFPIGPCTSIMAHCNSDTAHWEYMGKGVSMQDAGTLEPGDVCVCTSHVIMYVGNEVIKEKYPSAPDSYDFVSASLNERSPGCGDDSFHYDTRDYFVFRLKKYDESGKYKTIADGKNWDGEHAP